MKGLEVSEIKLSAILLEKNVFRFDAEYYKKEYLHEENARNKFKNILLGKIAYITDGQHGYHEVDETSDIKHLTAKNAKNWFADDIDADRIAKWVDDNNQRSSLKKDDIILSTRGSVGYCSIVDSEVLPANIDQDVARINLETTDIKPEVLLSYLNSKVGQDWIERNSTGMVQQGLSLWRLRDMPIPIFENKFQHTIVNSIREAKKGLDNSRSTYTQAEQLLLQAIGLNNFKPTTQNTNVKTLNQSFAASGRLDAEYYLPKYEELESVLQKFTTIRIKDLVNTPVASGSTPSAGDDRYYTDRTDGIPFLRAVDIINSEVSLDNPIYIKREVHEKILKNSQLKQNDVLFSIAGTVGRCGIYLHNQEANINQACARLRFDEQKVNRLYLITFFNSSVGNLLVQKYSKPGVQTNLNLAELGELYLPIIDKQLQQQISTLIQQSFALKKESKALLAKAKLAVEVAIEEGEERGMEILKH